MEEEVSLARRLVFLQARTVLIFMSILFAVFLVCDSLGYGDHRAQTFFTIGLTPMISGAYLGVALLYLSLPFRDIEFFATAVGAVLFEGYLFEQRPFTWDMATRFGAVGVGVGAACWLAIVYRIWVTRGSQREQAKGYLCVASILPLFPKVSSWWHFLVTQNTPVIYDQYGYALDGLLGCQPAILMERFFLAQPLVHGLALAVYDKLPLLMVVATLFWLNRPSRVYFNPLAVMVITAPCCMLIYYILPMIGISLIFSPYPPIEVPILTNPVVMPLRDNVPVSCMPSMHVTWILIIFLCVAPHGRRWAALMGALVFLTLMATLGREAGHYVIDLCMAVPFLLFFLGVFANPHSENRRLRSAGVLFGGVSFALTIYAIRYHIQFLLAHRGLTLAYFCGVLLVSVFLHYKLASTTLKAQAKR